MRACSCRRQAKLLPSRRKKKITYTFTPKTKTRVEMRACSCARKAMLLASRQKKKLLASHVKKKNRVEMRACSCIRKASLRCHHGSAALWPSIAGLSSSASTGVSISYILLYYYSNNYYYTNNCSIVVSVLVV